MEAEMQSLVPRQPLPNLGTLPQDVVQTILQKHGPLGAEKFKLISPVWYWAVRSFLVDRTFRPPIRMVTIDQEVAQWHTKNVHVAVELDSRGEAHFPFFKQWVQASRNSTTIPTDMMEDGKVVHTNIFYLTSPTLIIGTDRLKIFFTMIYALLALSLAFRVHIFSAIFLLVTMIAVLSWLYFAVKPSMTINRERLSRLFSYCSYVGTLVLIGLDDATIKLLQKNFGSLPVKNLCIVTPKCDQSSRRLTVELAKAQKPEKLTLCLARLDASALRQFFIDLTESVKLIEIYEKTPSSQIFSKTRDFWENEVRQMSDDSFSVQVMNGEPLKKNESESSYALRLRVGA